MLDQRIQVLLSIDQRRRLEAEARRRGVSVGSLIREAVDARFGAVTREDRLRAVREIREMRGGRFLSAEKINRLVEQEREEGLVPPPRGGTG